jgi:hypothetical protein
MLLEESGVGHFLIQGVQMALRQITQRDQDGEAFPCNYSLVSMTGLVSFERVFEVLDLPLMIEESAQAVPIAAGPASIEFDRVTFRYPSAAEVSLASLESVAVAEKRPQNTVLHDVSFSISAGQLVALVGPSGAGKTTITQLVLRRYDAQSVDTASPAARSSALRSPACSSRPPTSLSSTRPQRIWTLNPKMPFSAHSRLPFQAALRLLLPIASRPSSRQMRFWLCRMGVSCSAARTPCF